MFGQVHFSICSFTWEARWGTSDAGFVKALSGQLGSLTGFLSSVTGFGIGASGSWIMGSGRRRIDGGCGWTERSRTRSREAMDEEGSALISSDIEDLDLWKHICE
jgi:hypothetical protein